MNHKLSVLFSAATLLTAGLASAQTQYNLVGLTRFTGTLQQTRHSPCATMPSCVAGGMPPPAVFTAGGTAFDGTDNNIWATNGQQLAKYSGPTSCTLVCGPVPCPKSTAAANASGLDVVESLNELWIVDDFGWLTRCAIACPPTIITQCNIVMLPGDRTTGVAVDDGRGLVFYTALSAAGSRLYVAQIATPCAPFSMTPLLDCLANPVPAMGVAADWGTASPDIYWTDGPSTFSRPYSYNPAGPSITFGPQTCCTFIVSPNDPYTDLTLRPRGSSPAGNPCANGTCPSCTNWHSLRNAPILGNTLQLGLDNAPEASFAWCLVRIGSCTTGMPTLPPLCGPLLVSGAGPTLGFNVTSGAAGCLGSTTFNLPLPPLPGFAGLPLASQCIVFCPVGVGGFALSNCQSWVLSAL